MFEKRAICFGVTNGFGNSESAINMLANKAVDLSNYAVRTVKFNEAENIFADMAQEYKQNKTVNPVIVNTLG